MQFLQYCIYQVENVAHKHCWSRSRLSMNSKQKSCMICQACLFGIGLMDVDGCS